MKLLTIISSALAVAADFTTDHEYLSWKQRHSISFPTIREDSSRYETFKAARSFVSTHNTRAAAGLETYTVNLNKFAALTNSEFAQKYLSKTRDYSDPVVSLTLEYTCPVDFTDNGSTSPDTITYTSLNTDGQIWVTSVKDQGSCGSCWTFGAGAAIEGALCKSDPSSYDCSTWSGVSEQQLVDCASYTPNSDDPNVIDLNPYDNHGCNGGWQKNAMRYVFLQGGIMNWDDYSYVSGSTKTEGPCSYNADNAIINPITTCGQTTSGDEAQLLKSVAQNGVHTIAIDAGGLGFQLYSGGVYSSTTCSSTALNHAVTLTGYGAYLYSEEYWEVKNSWGSGWGVEGYIWMERGVSNMCGVATDASWAI